MPLRRDAWFEWDDDDACSLAIRKWTNDLEALTTAIKETGWVASGWQAHLAAEEAELVHGWCGYIDGFLVMCDSSGASHCGQVETPPEQVTVATVPYKFCSSPLLQP
jgi:hypothetical protein